MLEQDNLRLTRAGLRCVERPRMASSSCSPKTMFRSPIHCPRGDVKIHAARPAPVTRLQDHLKTDGHHPRWFGQSELHVAVLNATSNSGPFSNKFS